ncbi:DUF3016 domain-containing protein [Pseudoalteromonas citrea]|uniref:DUF3016 domain-containing protein n=1 Tax=Pseudoalteromonas citrea TaxID=43655 RepID=A0A5S3XNN9_9GAMM|nr:DUF3016 domain-containing protein [Pseudoalteromonas citrea]TMP41522.1 DUF3016 domain-containing protein [Pseudoalteromonas citrea]TMP56425.1 DUF3016 domain-containing protein [Pseudoalteromonas citrea]
MNKLNLVILMVCTPFLANAGEASVKWLDFNDYRDVRPANESKSSYHKRIAKQFEKHIQKLMAGVPAGYKLDLTFEDIDLAGDVRFNMHDIRIIKSIHFPRMKLSYTLTDKSGKVLAQADKKVIKDLSFMDRIRMGRDEAFYFDKRLLKDWFDEHIDAVIPKS